MSRETPFEQVTAVLPEPIRSGCLALPQPVWEHCQEIRLTSGQPVSLYGEGRLRFLGEGALLDEPQGALCATAAQVRSCVQACCEYSLYSHQDQIAQGFLTIRGGHRVGLCGKRFYSPETGETVHEFEAVNLRIARGLGLLFDICHLIGDYFRQYHICGRGNYAANRKMNYFIHGQDKRAQYKYSRRAVNRYRGFSSFFNHNYITVYRLLYTYVFIMNENNR